MAMFFRFINIIFLCGICCSNIAYADSFNETLSIKKPATNFSKLYLKLGTGIIKYKNFKEIEDAAYNKKSPKGKSLYNIAIGYNISDKIALEISGQHATAEYKDSESLAYDEEASNVIRQKFKTTAVFMNGYYNINSYNGFVPYFTAGIGMSKNKAEDKKIVDFVGEQFTIKGKTTTNFIWNMGAGVKYNFTKNLAFDLSCRYINLGKIKTQKLDDEFFSFAAASQKLSGYQFLGSVVYSL